MIRPSYGDIKYMGLDRKDKENAYVRDVALYEQAEEIKSALEKASSTSTTTSTYSSPPVKGIFDEYVKDCQRKDRPKRYGEGSDTNIKYCKLARDYKNLVLSSEKLHEGLSLFLFMTFVLNFSCGSIVIIVVQSDFIRALLIAIYPLLLVGLLIRNLIARINTKRIIKQQEKINKFIWDNRTYKEPVKKEVKSGIVLTLEH